MQESNFQSEFRTAITTLFKCHYYKIPDLTTFDNAHSIKRPYDSYFLFDGVFFACELKQMKKCESFPFSRIEEHQIQNLLNVREAGGKAFVVVNYRFTVTDKAKSKFGLKSNKNNFSIAFDISMLVSLKENLEKQGKKSFPISEIINYLHGKNVNGIYIIPWDDFGKNKIWRMDKLVEQCCDFKFLFNRFGEGLHEKTN